MDQGGLVLQGNRPLQCHLCVQEAQEAQGCHPHPSCHPAQSLLCTLALGGPALLGAPRLLLVLVGLAPQEAPGCGDRHPHLQVARVHLWSLGAQRALPCLEAQVNPSLQVPQEDQVALEALGIPLVLFGHLFRHILEHPGIQGGLEDQGDLVGPADHSHLVPLSEGQHSQGVLEAHVLLLGHQGRGVPDLRVDQGQECHP